MRILVTGAAGFIGSHVAEALLARGDTVAGLDNFNDYYSPARKRANVALLLSHPRFTLHEADLRDAEAMERICTQGRFDAVVHLAAMAGVRYSIERAPLYVEVNVRGTVNLLEGVRKAGTPHFVFASTSSVYGRTDRLPFREDDPLGRPLAPYPATKIAGEVMGHAYHNLFGLSFTALRFFSVYGPRGRPDMMPYHITDCIVHDRTFTLYEGGEMHRDWTYIDDIVAGVVAAVDRPMGYEVINLGRGEPVRMADFVELIEELVGKPARMTTPPAPPSEPPITYADISKARALLDYNPTTSVAEGMRRFWEWYREKVLDKRQDAGCTT
ncbi:MAG TPA: NAD-dependent epimerase/dehydratase family protein [Thermoflexia bacterium]|nr:NAD-dependent epimerase/dehydratase family protein [Thermoflexia bacterium]